MLVPQTLSSSCRSLSTARSVTSAFFPILWMPSRCLNSAASATAQSKTGTAAAGERRQCLILSSALMSSRGVPAGVYLSYSGWKKFSSTFANVEMSGLGFGRKEGSGRPGCRALRAARQSSLISDIAISRRCRSLYEDGKAALFGMSFGRLICAGKKEDDRWKRGKDSVSAGKGLVYCWAVHCICRTDCTPMSSFAGRSTTMAPLTAAPAGQRPWDKSEMGVSQDVLESA